MSFEADLKSHLNSGSVTTLVSDRVMPMFRANQALPAVTYQVISQQPENCIDGHTSGITKFRIQVDCFATRHDGLLALKSAVMDRMNTAAATFTSIMEFGQDIYEDETGLYRSILDFSCGFKE